MSASPGTQATCSLRHRKVTGGPQNHQLTPVACHTQPLLRSVPLLTQARYVNTRGSWDTQVFRASVPSKETECRDSRDKTGRAPLRRDHDSFLSGGTDICNTSQTKPVTVERHSLSSWSPEVSPRDQQHVSNNSTGTRGPDPSPDWHTLVASPRGGPLSGCSRPFLKSAYRNP